MSDEKPKIGAGHAAAVRKRNSPSPSVSQPSMVAAVARARSSLKVVVSIVLYNRGLRHSPRSSL